MSRKDFARRTKIAVFFDGVDISEDINRYLLSLSYTDNEEDSTDDLTLSLEDADGVWLTEWLNNIISSAAENDDDDEETESAKTTKNGKTVSYYTVTKKSGVDVSSRPADGYYIYGTLAYGASVTAEEVKDGWVKFKYSGKTAYVPLSALSVSSAPAKSAAGGDRASKGLNIQASIIRENTNSDGKDDVLDCGLFELDSVSYSGVPSTISIKGTSLSYSGGVRQTKKSKSWEAYTLSGIASEISSRGGMACMFLSECDPYYDRAEQLDESDISFLSRLCHTAGASLKCTNNILVIFDAAEYEAKKPVRTIKRGDGSYTTFSLKSGKANKAYALCRVSYVKTDGTLIEGTAYASDYDKTKKDNQCLEISAKVGSTEEAKALASKMLRLRNKYEYTASFTFPGETSLCAGMTVTLEDFGAWSGNYIIKSAKHIVSRSGYTTQTELRRKYDG